MMELRFQQKENIGFRFVLDAMAPSSAYGREALRLLQPMDRTKKAELLRQLGNIRRMLEGEYACTKALNSLLRVLMSMKMLRPTAEKCLETGLNEIELFEIKRFLLQTKELLPYWQEVQQVLQLEGISIVDTAEALKILDPEGNGVATFYIGDTASGTLQEIRVQKRLLEQQLQLTVDAKEKEQLLIRRSEAAGREEAEEARIREEMSRQLRPHIPAMLQNMQAIADLDLTVEKARLARRWGGVMPTLTENRLCLQDMANPQVAELLRTNGREFTPISLELEQGVTVITGANMGGKSVALKALVLNVLLVQHGFFPFAKLAQVPLFDGIHMLSEDLENVDRGLSSFGGEIVAFNQVVSQLDKGLHLVMLDEFARGTNPEEGAAIVKAVTRYLNTRPAMTVLATHFDAVAPLAKTHYQVVGLQQMDMAQLQRELAGLSGADGVAQISRYMNYGLYRVQEDQNCPRDALNVCRLLGMPPEILELAENS